MENDPATANRFIREAKRVAAELGVRLWAPDELPETIPSKTAPEATNSPKIMKQFCPFPWSQLVVKNDGEVSPCCYLTEKLDDGTEFYNLRDHSPREAWNSPALVSLRRRMRAGCPPQLCIECPYINSAGT